MLFGKQVKRHEVKLLLVLTLGLAFAWVFEPTLLASNWLSRVILAVACLLAAGIICRIDSLRQAAGEKSAQRYIDTLCRLDHHEMSDPDLTDALPELSENGHWASIFSQVRECLVEYGVRADEAEHNWTSAEVRLRRVTTEYSRLNDFASGFPDAALATNQYGELVWANQVARHIFHLTIDEDQPLRAREQLNNNCIADVISETLKRRSSVPRTCELEMANGDGDLCWYRISCRALVAEGDDGTVELNGSVAVLADISSERGIQRRHAEFVSAASHEMKTPLAGVRAYVELLLDGEAEDEETREEFLTVIDTQAERLQRLIENLLNLARIEAGVEKVDKQTHSLNELLENAFSVVQPSSEQKEINLVADLSPMYMGVLADKDMLMQSAINLLSNAIKYTAPGGKVTLRSRMEENAAVFEVEDTGVGLTDEDCDKVFEKFYRVKKDQKMAPGTGLGLPLAKHIVEDVHGGVLTVSSQLGAGSVFRISLPSHARTQTLTEACVG
jgi:two-component system, OmpR family, phosphate regulon sensor histidine kinase PhoR